MKLPIKGWQWIFYLYGWLTGILNLAFWVIMAILYFTLDKGKGAFFSKKFHYRVFIWGLVVAILSFFYLIFGLLLGVLFIPFSIL